MTIRGDKEWIRICGGGREIELMNLSPNQIELFKEYKSSSHQIGFSYYDHLYLVDKRKRKRRPVLKRVVLREAKKKARKYLSRHKVIVGFDKGIKKVMAARKWGGYLNESQDWKRYNYLTCAHYGMLEENIKGDKRHLIFNCNQRKLCIGCNEQYRRDRAHKAEDFAARVMEANDIEHLRKFRLTFPDFIRDQIVARDHQTIFKNLANEFLQEIYGCTKDEHGRYERGSVGVGVQWHYRSTQECFKDSPHMHAYVIPLRVDGDKVENVDGFINKLDIEYMKTRWAEKVKQCCLDLGYKGIEKITDDLVVDLAYKTLPEKMIKGERPGFDFEYDMRSPAHDLQKAVAAVSMEDKRIIMSFERLDIGYFENWSFKEYVNQLSELLKLRNLNSSYGWLRRGEFYAKLLGVEVQKEEDKFEPVPELSVRTEYKREYRIEVNTKQNKTRLVYDLYVRSLKDANSPGDWVQVDPLRVHVEGNLIESRKKRTYSVAKNRSPP